MRIAVIPSWSATTINPVAGIYMLEQAIDLSESYDVEYLSLDRSIIPALSNTKTKNLNVYIKKTFFFPRKNYLFLSIWAAFFYNFFKKRHEIKKFDVIHAHDHIAAFAAFYIHNICGIPYVVTLHNTGFLDGTIEKWRIKYIQNSLNKASSVICVGKQLLHKIISDFKLQNAVYVPNYTDTTKFKSIKSKTNVFQFVSIGALQHKKGFDILISSFSELRNNFKFENVSLIIAGDGPDRKKLQKLIKQAQLENFVHLISWLQHDEITELLSGANCYVCSSRVETFSIATLEALACGVPVIVTKCGGPEDFVKEFQGIIVRREDINALSKAMKQMIDYHKNYNAQLISEYVIQNYDKRTVLPQIEKYLELATTSAV